MQDSVALEGRYSPPVSHKNRSSSKNDGNRAEIEALKTQC